MNDEDENPIKLKTIEGDSSDKVQYVTYELDDPAILGYGQLPEQEPEDEEPIKEPAEQFVLTAESEDGIAVTVTGDPESLPYPVEKITLSVQPVTDEEDHPLCPACHRRGRHCPLEADGGRGESGR